MAILNMLTLFYSNNLRTSLLYFMFLRGLEVPYLVNMSKHMMAKFSENGWQKKDSYSTMSIVYFLICHDLIFRADSAHTIFSQTDKWLKNMY